jgi:transcription antitermination factor NusG
MRGRRPQPACLADASGEYASGAIRGKTALDCLHIVVPSALASPNSSFAMPILPSEPDCHPANLWDDSDAILNQEASIWWCLHTKPRQEKATARDLRTQGIVYYLPQVVKESRTPQGRAIQSIVPLFPGYVFIKGDPSDRLNALRGHRLVNVLEVVDQETLTSDLRQIHAMLSSGLSISPEQAVPVGAKVRIVTGPLTGIVGTVVRRGKRDQFIAMVNFLGRGAMVDLQDWQVERVDGP